MDTTSHTALLARLSDAVVRALLRMNGAAAAMLLAAVLLMAIWQEAAVDFVMYIAVALALHGIGMLTGVCGYAFRYLRAHASRPGGRASLRFLSIMACALSAACFAAGLAVIVWGALTVLGAGDYDPQTQSVPLGWSRT